MSSRPQTRIRKKRTRRRGFWYLLRRRFAKRARPKKEIKPSDLRRRNQIRKRNAFIIKLSLLATLVVGMFVGMWKLARLERFTITNINVRGAEIINEESLKEVVVDSMKGSVALIFPRQNTFFVPMAKIESQLKNEFIAANHVNLLRKGLDELIVVVQERQPVAIFCAERVGQIGNCFFADKAGVLYRPVPHIAHSQYQTIYFEEQDEEKHELGSALLVEAEMNALSVFVEILFSNSGIKADRITLNSDRSFRINTDQGYSIVVPVKEDYTNELSRLLTALTADVFKEEISIESVREFDLRFGRKVFYKFNEGEGLTQEVGDELELEELE